jgi:hypothetical protein
MDEKRYIKLCINKINQKLNWKDVNLWTDTDYRNLAELIGEETKIAISSHTLKRLFGKLPYKEEYHPQIASKNALAKFVGYRDWNDLLLSNKPTIEAQKQEAQKVNQKGFLFIKKKLLIQVLSGVIGLVLIILLFTLLFSDNGKIRKSDYSFELKDSVGTIPHNVTLLYDVSAIKQDSIFVDFDFKHPVLGPQILKLDKSKKVLNFTYQVPGIYNVRLKYKNQILADRKFYALSEDWISYFIPENDRFHLWMDNVIMDDSLSRGLYISRLSLQKQGFNTNQIFDTMHRLMKNFGIDGDNYRLKLQFKNSMETGGITCFDTEIKLHCANYLNYICLTEKGCQQYSKLQFGEIERKGNDNDLSKLTFQPNQINNLELECKNRLVTVKLNEQEIHQESYQKTNGSIMGIDCVMKGTGIIYQISLENLDGTNRFEQNFDLPSKSN